MDLDWIAIGNIFVWMLILVGVCALWWGPFFILYKIFKLKPLLYGGWAMLGVSMFIVFIHCLRTPIPMLFGGG